MWTTIVIQPFVNVLLLINSLVHNFGVSIILFTVLIRLLTHPLTVKQFKATKSMQNLQEDPRYKKMQEKYKNDKERLAQEQMKLYKEHGVNPMGSCLPTLIQFPLIIGLYQSVIRAMAASPYELFRLERIVYPWLNNAAKLLPLENQFLWMDLGQPERINLFGLSIPLLAILVVITTFLQSKLIQPPSDGNDQAAMMSKSMSIYMPLLMGFMSYSLASGLALYFLVSNIFGIVQYSLLGRSNWANIFPFLKKDEDKKETPDKKKPVVLDAKAADVPKVEKDEIEDSSRGKMRMPKRKRPKRKKNN
ncbi:MAG: YidC/Oxa1 family membrane protein insertase [Chloroflexota bacterium]|nr:YidC/Oxa1 family membrane protein insertase [Chloroflexota bacterium]